jgi:hypothetical protein
MMERIIHIEWAGPYSLGCGYFGTTANQRKFMYLS